MGMTITIEIIDRGAEEKIFDQAFAYFSHIDEKFSTYKHTSEIAAVNDGKITGNEQSEEMRLILALCEETRRATGGYFDIKTPSGKLDPSGLVKGWAILNVAQLILKNGFRNFYVDAGGDIQTCGRNTDGVEWSIGIRNPWNEAEVVKTVYASDKGVATSGTYIRGLHVYDPKRDGAPVNDIVSLTVIGPNIYEADRMATAAFAMGKAGINYIESLPGFEGYLIDTEKKATMTSGFKYYARTRTHAHV